MLTLTIPPKRDPFARGLLLALVFAVALLGIYGGATQAEPASAQANENPIIIVPTAAQPTPALPTVEQPAIGLAQPTPAPGWLDQALTSVATAGDQFASEQADQLAQEQAAAEAQANADREQYLANVGAQAAHSPRGDVQQPPAYQAGPVEVQPGVVIDPNPQAAPVAQVAVQSPAISAEQAAVLAQRESNSCKPGEVFYPRTGCHAPGSGGEQPGPVSR